MADYTNQEVNRVALSDFIVDESTVEQYGGVPEILDNEDVVPGIYRFYVEGSYLNTDPEERVKSMGLILGIDEIVEVSDDLEDVAPREGLLMYSIRTNNGMEEMIKNFQQLCFSLCRTEEDPTGKRVAISLFRANKNDPKLVLQRLAETYSQGGSMRIETRVRTSPSADGRIFINFGKLKIVDKDQAPVQKRTEERDFG